MRTIALAKPSVNFNTMSFKDGFSYSYEVVDEDQISTLDSIKLYYNGSLVNVESIENRYSQLFSDNAYELVVNLLCDYKDGKQPKLEEYRTSVVTLPLEDIEFNVTATADKTSIKHDYKMIDADNVGTIKEVRLYLDGELVATNKDITIKEFNDVLSDNNYVVAYVVEKNFRDNDIVYEEEFFTSVTTDYYNTPSVELSFTSTAEAIDVTVTKYDIDSILKLNKLSIYKGNTLVNIVESFNDLLISNLESNTVYRFVLEYEYDLNNGDGSHVETVEEVYSTLAYNVSVSGFAVLNETAVKTNEEVNIRVYLENRSKVRVSYLIVNNEKLQLSGGDGYNNLVFVLRAPNKSGVMNINIQKMGYILNGIEVEQLVEGENTLQIPVLSRLDIISVSTVNGFSMYKNYGGHGFVVEIDNPEGFTINQLYIGSSTYKENSTIFEVVHITDNILYFDPRIDIHDFLQTRCIINGLVYTDDNGNIVERKYSSIFPLDITVLDRDYILYTLPTHVISKPEDLLNVQEGQYYELSNDIDMSGYNWVPLGNVYVDGKGHTIKNLTYVYEDEYSSGITSASIGGTFSNVYFQNVYFSIESKRQVDITLFQTDNFENLLISGNINVKTPSYTYNNFGVSVNDSQVYIVDNLKYNNKNYQYGNHISTETFESEEFKLNTLGWGFTNVNVREELGYKYTILHDSYVVINKYTGTDSEVIVPQKLNNLPVVGIEDLAFENNKYITSFEIPQSILYVGGSILKGCSNLEKIVLNNCENIIRQSSGLPVSYIFGGQEFDDAYYVPCWDIGYYVPYTLKYLEFNGERSLSNEYELNITLENLSSIVDTKVNIHLNSLFLWNCGNLENIDISKNLNNIELVGCEKLTELKLPDTIRSFAINQYIDTIYIPSNCNNDDVNSTYVNNLYYGGTIEDLINDTYLYREVMVNHFYNLYLKNNNGEYSIFKDVVIPKNIKTLNYGIFSYDSIETITFEEGSTLKTIGDSTFTDCDNLKSITLPSTVESIGAGAFNGCMSLETFIFPEMMTEIKNSTFHMCKKLNNISIPDGITVIEESAFSGCEALEIVNISNTVKEIGAHAFSNCISLKSIIIPDSVTKLGESAFQNCYKLSSIQLSKSLNKIEGASFIHCSELKSITIPDNIIEIGESAFVECVKLAKLDLGKGVKKIGKHAFQSCSSIRNLIIPNNVTEIGVQAFNCLNQMTSLTLSSNLKVIEEYAFGSCNALESLVIPEGVIEIKANAFVNANSLKTLSLPSTLEKIGESAFTNNRLEELIMPKNLKEIGYSAFYGSWNLTKLVLNDGLVSIDTGAFMGCELLTSVTIPSSVQYIGSNAFAQNSVGNLTIYCNVATRPDGWERDWSMNCNVIWKQ